MRPQRRVSGVQSNEARIMRCIRGMDIRCDLLKVAGMLIEFREVKTIIAVRRGQLV